MTHARALSRARLEFSGEKSGLGHDGKKQKKTFLRAHFEKRTHLEISNRKEKPARKIRAGFFI
jgi:hypothetical protein